MDAKFGGSQSKKNTNITKVAVVDIDWKVAKETFIKRYRECRGKEIDNSSLYGQP